MLRLSLVLRLFSTNTPVYKGYTIKKLAYLVQAPPTRPASGFNRFVSEQYSSDQKLSVVKHGAIVAAKWKNSPQLHQKFNKQYEEEKEVFNKEIKPQYENKFVVPFKRINYRNLLVSNLYKEKKINVVSKDVKQYAKAVQEEAKKITPEEKERLTAEANKINAKRRRLQEKLKFPLREYFTEEAYTRSHKVSKTLGIRERRRQQKDQYQEYLEEWEGKVAEWLQQNNYSISIQDFTKLYNKTYRQAKKLKEEKEEEKENEKEKERKEEKEEEAPAKKD